MPTNFEKGYLDDPYLSGDSHDYLGGQLGWGTGIEFSAEIVDSLALLGAQFQGNIDNQNNYGTEYQGEIAAQQNIAAQFQGTLDKQNNIGSQFQGKIDDQNNTGMQWAETIAAQLIAGTQFEALTGQQSDIGIQFQGELINTLGIGIETALTVAEQKAIGTQFLGDLKDKLLQMGLQYEAGIIDQLEVSGVQFTITNQFHSGKGKYLVDSEGYLSESYLAEKLCVFVATQFQSVVENQDNVGLQLQGVVDTLNNYGLQFQGNIVDELKPIGVQFDSVTATRFGVEFNVSLYNTTNIRIMCRFPSRGSEVVGGTNEFGNTIGTGENWEVTTGGTASGDFSVFNVNTDIVEQVYRSTGTSVVLTCDTELSTTAVDTLAILGHNLTQGATITFIGATDAAFSNVIFSKIVQANPTNTYYILPEDEFPPQQARFYRIAITDSANSDGYIELGTILFGASDVFQGECVVDEIQFELRDFADTVETEGFTNVAVSRAQRRFLGLEFRSLDIGKGNYDTLRGLFTFSRTVLKCLWIPTPSTTNQAITDRYAVFGKMVQVPVETHNSKGPTETYVSLSIEIDESK